MDALLSRACELHELCGASGWTRTTGPDLRRVVLLPLSYGRGNGINGRGGRTRTCVRRVKAGCLRPLDYAPFDLQGLPRTFSHASSRHDCCRQKQPVVMQHALKGPRRSADTRVVATELLAKFLVAMNDTVSPLDAGFGWESVAALTGLRKS
jgi:hypothetical protein